MIEIAIILLLSILISSLSYLIAHYLMKKFHITHPSNKFIILLLVSMTVFSSLILINVELSGKSIDSIEIPVESTIYPSTIDSNRNNAMFSISYDINSSSNHNNYRKDYLTSSVLSNNLLNGFTNNEQNLIIESDKKSNEYNEKIKITKETIVSYSQTSHSSIFTTYFIYENIPFNGIAHGNPINTIFDSGSSVLSTNSNNIRPKTFDVVSWFLSIQLILIFIGVYYFLMSLFGGKIFTLQKLKATTCDDPQIISLISEISREFKMKMPRVLIAKTKPNAFVFGYPKTLVISSSLLETLTNEELRIVLKHELAHMKNHDIILKPFLQSIRFMFFYNPVIHFLYYQMIKERELMADLYFLHDQRDKILFVETLMKINTHIRNHYFPQSLITVKDSSLLSLLPREKIKVGISDRYNCLFGKTIRKTIVTCILVFVLIVLNIGMLGVSQEIMNSSKGMTPSESQDLNEQMFSFTLVVKEQSRWQTTCDDEILLIQENTAYIYPYINKSNKDAMKESFELVSLYHEQIIKYISLSSLGKPWSIRSTLREEPVCAIPF